MKLLFNGLIVEDEYSTKEPSTSSSVFKNVLITKAPLECINCRFDGVKNGIYSTGNQHSHYLFTNTQFNSAGWPQDNSAFFTHRWSCIFECSNCLFSNVTLGFAACDQIIIKDSIFKDINVIDDVAVFHVAVIKYQVRIKELLEKVLIFENVEINNVRFFVYILYIFMS